MWDVVWTDPDKELVGEHRAKKGRMKGDKEKDSIRSGRDSATTSSSNSSFPESPFSFFRSRSAKNAITLKENDSNRSPSFSGLATPSVTSTISPISPTFDSSSRRSSGLVTTAPTSPTKDGSVGLFSNSDHDTFPSFDECLAQSFGSIASSAALPKTSLSPGGGNESPNIADLIRMLGDLPPRVESQDKPPFVANDPETTNKPKSSEGETPSIDSLLATPPKSPAKYPGQSCLSGDVPESPVLLTPPPKSPRRPTATVLGINNPAAWRTPSQWKAHDAKKVQKAAKTVLQDIEDHHDIEIEAFAMPTTRMGVRSAAGAPTAMVLAKVKQVLASRSDEEGQEIGPGNSKQHWMLSLLHGLGYITDPDLDERNIITLPPPKLVMLLYETRVYATYLSSIHAKTQVYHITKEAPGGGWSHYFQPSCNIQSIQAPSADATCFPVAPRLFQTVYSFSLPSSCPYNLLPNILGSVYKCLKPGGSFKASIIDPLPCVETLGQKLRAWMEQHLFVNIERNSRCLEPSRLFPKILGDAGLRGKGSRRTKVKFFALQENARGDEYHDPDPSIDRMYQEKRDKAELRSLVGRMFWVEVWGKYITPPNTWWWDDPECVAECRELGTFWEYHIIDAVKSENV